MPFPLYTLPTDEASQKHIHPDPHSYGGYSYSPPLRELPLMAKIIGVIMFFTVFPPMWALYVLVWYFFIN